MPFRVVPVLIVFAIGTVWLRLAIVRTTYAINQAERTGRDLRQEREELELKVTGLRSPRRLERLAHDKLGARPPEIGSGHPPGGYAVTQALAKPGAGLPVLARDPVKGRVTALVLFCGLFALAVLGRAALVQVATSPRLEQMARRQFQSKVLIRPRRGEILDRNGDHLAINVGARARWRPIRPRSTIRARWPVCSRTRPTSLTKKRCSGSRAGKEFVWLKRHLSDAELRRLRRYRVIDDGGELVSGLMMVKESKRVYPHGELAARLLGGVNVDSDGLEGVELWQNERLRGKVLSVNAIKDAMGRPTFIDAVTARSVQEHRDGEDVRLTIDSALQYSVEQSLKAAVSKAGARGVGDRDERGQRRAARPGQPARIRPQRLRRAPGPPPQPRAHRRL